MFVFCVENQNDLDAVWSGIVGLLSGSHCYGCGTQPEAFGASLLDTVRYIQLKQESESFKLKRDRKCSTSWLSVN